ncbi:hypothetical protein G6F33_012202 [Rhizopus arrhizus]|nr:hypothetical protein G6F33_012202 [Rhizopus arrhizus]
MVDWKYELALKELIDKNLLMKPTEENMKELGNMYLQEVSIVYESRCEGCTTEESSMVDMLDNDSFFKICTSPQIQKLLRLAAYSAQALNDAIDNCISSAENSQTSNDQEDNVELRYYQILSIDEQMIFLWTTKIFGKSIKNFGLKLQSTLTRKERDMLLEISRCIDLTIFDNAFIYDKNFITKRADCISNITKEFDDIANQRVDFILRSLNDDTDYLSAEEKPDLKDVKKDIGKGKTLQMAMLRKWTQYVVNSRISNLEAITCQWQGIKLQIIGTKYISQSHSISYNKGVFVVPKIVNNLASFAQTLAAVLSLKRLVYLNYSKINVILEAKRQHDIEFMHFQGGEIDDDILLRSDSTAGYDSINDEQIIDVDLEEDIKEAIQNIKRDDDIVTVQDWEEFVVKREAMHLLTMNQFAAIGLNSKGFPPLLACRFYSQMVRAQLDYGLAISPLTTKLIHQLDTFQNQCIRRIFSGHSRSSVQVMLHLVNLPSMRTRVAVLQAQYLFRSTHLPDDTLLAHLLPYIQSSTSRSHWYKLSVDQSLIL